MDTLRASPPLIRHSRWLWLATASVLLLLGLLVNVRVRGKGINDFEWV